MQQSATPPKASPQRCSDDRDRREHKKQNPSQADSKDMELRESTTMEKYQLNTQSRVCLTWPLTHDIIWQMLVSILVFKVLLEENVTVPEIKYSTQHVVSLHQLVIQLPPVQIIIKSLVTPFEQIALK